MCIISLGLDLKYEVYAGWFGIAQSVARVTLQYVAINLFYLHVLYLHEGVLLHCYGAITCITLLLVERRWTRLTLNDDDAKKYVAPLRIQSLFIPSHQCHWLVTCKRHSYKHIWLHLK